MVAVVNLFYGPSDEEGRRGGGDICRGKHVTAWKEGGREGGREGALATKLMSLDIGLRNSPRTEGI